MKDKTEHMIMIDSTYKAKNINDWYETIYIEAWDRQHCKWRYIVVEDSMEPDFVDTMHYITNADLLEHYTLISVKQQANIYDELKSILLA